VDRKKTVQIGIIILAVAGAAAFFVFGRGDSEAAKYQYFYDLSEKRLYRAPRAGFAPEAGVGGAPGDGVEAVVVGCPDCGTKSLRIAYLKTHTPEYKQKHDAAVRTGVPIEGLTRPWIADHTLVRLVDGDKWYPASSEGGTHIVSEWRRRCPTHGTTEKPVQP